MQFLPWVREMKMTDFEDEVEDETERFWESDWFIESTVAKHTYTREKTGDYHQRRVSTQSEQVHRVHAFLFIDRF